MAGLAGGAGDPAAFQAGPQGGVPAHRRGANHGVYSNRFAAHIIRQHQFNALCVARGWRNKLRLMVDDVSAGDPGDARGDCGRSSGSKASVRTTERTRPRRNLPVPGHGPGPLLPDGSSGELRSRGRRRVLRRLVRAGSLAEPLDLEEISPLVFSEIMRDVDLFVGVASVGNDPTWSDGGPEGRFRDYWTSYSFGDSPRSPGRASRFWSA